MKKLLLIVIATLILFSELTTVSMAQHKKLVLPKIPGREEVEQGQAFERGGEHEKALELYRKVYDEHGTDNAFWHLLIVLDRLKKYDDLEDLINKRLKKNPGDFTMLRYLARAAFGRGDTKKGFSIIDDIISNNWRDVGRIHTAANELLRWNEHERALKIYLKARKALKNEKVFVNEIARIHSMRMEYSEALSEYMKILENVASVPSRIEQLIDSALQAGADETDLLLPLREYLGKRPQSVKCAKLLSDIYWERGDATKAVEVYLPALLKSKNMKELKAFAVRLKTTHPSEALKVFEAYAKNFTDDPLRKSILFEAAAIRFGLGDNSGALSIYKRIAKDYPDSREGETAQLRILAISGAAGLFSDFIESVTTFAGSAQHRGNSREAWVIAGRLMLAEGQPDSSLNYLGTAMLKSRGKAERYPISVLVAYTKFFSGDFKGMSETVTTALLSDPTGADTNDLLRLKSLIMQAGQTGADAAKAFANGKYALFRNMPDEASDFFMTACSDTSSTVAPHAALELAVLAADAGDIDASLAWYVKASAIATDPTLKVGSLLKAGDMLLGNTLDSSRAAELYREALLMFPEGVHQEEVRRKLMRLNDDI